MAVFLSNVCKFNGCGIVFQTLRELIQHIEETHIDFDPHVVEKQELEQPSSIPISYILRVFADTVPREGDVKRKPRAHSPASSICSSTPNGSEMEEDMATESEDSNDSWANNEEFSPEYILRMIGAAGAGEDKPFACPIPGCKKRYKNINGIKYHAKNGHRKDNNKARKIFKCRCGKSYKTAHGLKNHSLTHSAMTIPNLPSKDDAVAPIVGPKTATLALLIQGQHVKDPSVLAKLASGTLPIKEHVNGSAIFPISAINSSIPLEFKSTSMDQNSDVKKVLHPSLPKTEESVKVSTSLPQTVETVTAKLASLTPVLQQHLLSSTDTVKNVSTISISSSS